MIKYRIKAHDQRRETFVGCKANLCEHISDLALERLLELILEENMHPVLKMEIK